MAALPEAAGLGQGKGTPGLEMRGEIGLRDDGLVIGRSDQDEGYVILSRRGTLLMKQDGSDFGMELSKMELNPILEQGTHLPDR